MKNKPFKLLINKWKEPIWILKRSITRKWYFHFMNEGDLINDEPVDGFEYNLCKKHKHSKKLVIIRTEAIDD